MGRPQQVYLLGFVSGVGSTGEALGEAPYTQPGTTIFYHLPSATTETVRVVITAADGAEVATLNGRGTAGMTALRWAPRGRGGQMGAGDYTVTLFVGDKQFKTSVTVEDLSRSSDPNVFIPRE